MQILLHLVFDRMRSGSELQVRLRHRRPSRLWSPPRQVGQADQAKQGRAVGARQQMKADGRVYHTRPVSYAAAECSAIDSPQTSATQLLLQVAAATAPLPLCLVTASPLKQQCHCADFGCDPACAAASSEDNLCVICNDADAVAGFVHGATLHRCTCWQHILINVDVDTPLHATMVIAAPRDIVCWLCRCVCKDCAELYNRAGGPTTCPMCRATIDQVVLSIY